MKSLFRNSLFCLFTACLTAACNENTVYHSYQSLPDNGWGKSDTLSFFVPITDSLPPTLRLFAEVRNRTDYPYQDLHLFISQNLQDSTVWRTDTIAIHLTDSTGRWFGKGWGSVYQSETFIRSVRPLHPGNYTFKVVSGMKDDILQGINDGRRRSSMKTPKTAETGRSGEFEPTRLVSYRHTTKKAPDAEKHREPS